MNKSIRTVLLVEDNRGDARLVREIFKEQGLHDVELTHMECMGDAEKHLAENAFDVILLDLGLPDAHGLEAVRRTLAAAPRTPLVVLSGMDDESMGIQALLEGAQDYLIKGRIEPRELLRALRYAIARKKIEEALFAEKELAEVTLRCIGDAVICADASGRITFLNPIAETMTGSSLMEAVGKPMDSSLNCSSVSLFSTLPINNWMLASVSSGTASGASPSMNRYPIARRADCAPTSRSDTRDTRGRSAEFPRMRHRMEDMTGTKQQQINLKRSARLSFRLPSKPNQPQKSSCPGTKARRNS